MRVVIWDIWTRLFHWTLVACVFFLLFSGKTGTAFFEWHRPIGEAVAALILFRLCWALWGSSNNRLVTFFSHPFKAFGHLGHLFKRNMPPERGHNAAGGWASFAMLFLIGVQAVTGLFIADEDELLEGALYNSISSDRAEQLLDIHYINSSLIIAIVIVHVLMITLYRVWGKVNLVFPMITGKMNWPEAEPVPQMKIQHWAIGAITVAGAFLTIAMLTGWLEF